MSSCSYVAPTPNRATAATRRKSTGSHSSHTSSSTASGSGSLVSAAGSRGSSLNASFRSDGGGDVIIPSSTLDRTAQSAVQRIAMQLMKYEAANGDTSDLSAMDRCGKMLKRKVTAKVAALVEAAAAADAAAAAAAAAASSPSSSSALPVQDPTDDDRKRPVTTAGDALLTYLSTETAASQREYDESETQMEASQESVLQLLAQVDAMAEAVPSRRIAAALRNLHRSRLQLIDTRMKAQALESAKKYLRSIVLDGKNIADEVSHVVCSLRRSSSDHGIIYGCQSETMAGEFFYVLALGGLLRQT